MRANVYDLLANPCAFDSEFVRLAPNNRAKREISDLIGKKFDKKRLKCAAQLHVTHLLKRSIRCGDLRCICKDLAARGNIFTLIVKNLWNMLV